MDTYSREAIHQKVVEIINRPAEHIYTYEEIKELSDLLGIAQNNSDDDTSQELNWEYDLLCPVLGYTCHHEGKEVKQITDKWDYYLQTSRGFTDPFDNSPFCQWKKEAVPYYMKRFEEASNNLAKARYSFATMTLSTGKDRFSLAKASFECWLKVGEEYVRERRVVGSYHIASLAYGMAIRIALEFRQSKWAMAAVKSLSDSLTKATADDWKGWALELFRIFTKHIKSLEKSEENREQLHAIKATIISQLKDLIEKSMDMGEYQLVRCFIECLVELVDEDDAYLYMRRSAETHIVEGNVAPEGLLRYAFYERGLKAYKEIQDRFPQSRDQVEVRIEEITSVIKQQSGKIEWKTISASVSIEDSVKVYIAELKRLEHGALDKILEDRTCLIDLEKAMNMAIEQKELAPLSFILPVSVHNSEGPVREHRSEEALLDYKARCNITMSIRLFETVFVNVMGEMKDKIVEDDDIGRLLSHTSISDIRPTLEDGLNAMLKSPPNYLIVVHMLTPYVEEIIRRIVTANMMEDCVVEWERQKGRDEKTISFRKIELGGLLGNEEVQGLLGSEFSDSLKCFLTEQDQINFRNLLLHGLVPSSKVGVGDAYFLTYAVLKLIHVLNNAPGLLSSKSEQN